MSNVTDLLVVVQREWNGWRTAMTPLSALEDVHWHQPAGAPRALIHAYVARSALVSSALPCDGGGSEASERLRVCVLKCHTAAVAFQHLVDCATLQRSPRCPREPRAPALNGEPGHISRNRSCDLARSRPLRRL